MSSRKKRPDADATQQEAARSRLDLVTLLDEASSMDPARDGAGVIALYDDWLGANARHPLAHIARFNLGCARMDANQAREAAGDFAQCLNAKPDFHQAAFNLGVCKERLGLRQQALDAWQRLWALEDTAQGPEREFLLMGLHHGARLLAAQDRTEEARALLTRCLRLKPDQPEAASLLLKLAPAGAETHAHIYQICYSDATLRDRDPGFLCLDCRDNPRPDWREYWHIRRFLLGETLREGDYYGFFSPKFKSKTGLDASTVYNFIASRGGKADVILFSPFFDQGAFALNLFEQGQAQHADIMRAFTGSAALIAPGLDLETLVMDSRHVVFCNYFVAKPAFWREWLRCCEAIFATAEAGGTDFAASLNAGTNHDGGIAPNKVFVIERIASLILSTQARWAVTTYNPMLLPFSTAMVARRPKSLMMLDALKIAWNEQQLPEFLNEFFTLRAELVKP